MPDHSILFICLGNICRSPLAEGVFRHEAEKLGVLATMHIDSAGTGGWHVGQPPDPRSIETASTHGIDITHQTCRKLVASDFDTFDLVLCMDNANLDDCRSINHQGGSAPVCLFTQFAGMGNVEIPDPYYGGTDGFEIAYQMIKQASHGALERIFKR